MKRLLFLVYLCTVTMHSFSAESPSAQVAQQNKCSSCGKSYSERGTLRKHQTEYEKGYQYSCQVCGMRVKVERSLHHNDTHTNLKSAFHDSEKITFFCYYCNPACRISIKQMMLLAATVSKLTFKTSNELQAHVLSDHFKTCNEGELIIPIKASVDAWNNAHELEDVSELDFDLNQATEQHEDLEAEIEKMQDDSKK